MSLPVHLRNICALKKHMTLAIVAVTECFQYKKIQYMYFI